jgi:hypothetical protein
MSFIEKVHKFFGCKCEKCCANGNCKCESKESAPIVPETPAQAPAPEQTPAQ